MHFPIFSDEYFMKEALKEAEKAYDAEEVPVGAVIVMNKQVIARAHNSTQQLNDVTAHAEMIAITSAANNLGAKYLHECTLYVTLEPCPMCASALAWSQIDRVVYGASDPKAGYKRFGEKLLHPGTSVTSGILEHACVELMKTFFVERREMKN